MAWRASERRRQQGAVAMIVGLLAVLVLFGMLGIAVDLSYLYARKTELQNAADAAALLPMGGSGESLRYAAGFVVVFVASVFACGFLAWVAKKLVEAVGLRPADRTLGAVFGVLRGLVLLLAVAVVAGMTPVHEAQWWQESQGAPVLTQVLKGLKPALPDEFGRHLPS